MKTYLMSFILILIAGCVTNPFQLKQSEFLLRDQDKTKPQYRPRSQMPITTYHTLLGNESMKAYQQAIAWINNQAGCQIFKQPVHVFVDLPVAVYLKCWNRVAENNFIWPDEELENEYLGICTNRSDKISNIIEHSTVRIPCYRPFPETQVQVAAHELLHSLGFGHDRELATIMYHDYKCAALKLQEQDLYILRNYYCGETTWETIIK